MKTDNSHEHTRSDRLKPVEFLALSGGMAAFAGVVILIATRDLPLASIACGGTFIVALVVIAMLLVGKTSKPTDHDAQSQPSEAGRPAGEGQGHDLPH